MVFPVVEPIHFPAKILKKIPAAVVVPVVEK
jgi:hypothetical protein